MKTSGLTRTLAAVAAAAALTVTTAPAHAQQSKAGDPLFGAPTVGTCSTMTPAEGAARSDHSTAVDCAEAHTAQVAGVVRIPARMNWSTASANALFRVVASTCAPKVNDLLGRTFRTRDTSAYTYVFFEPTKAQRNAGARWLSCSVILRRNFKLATLPSSTAPMLPDGKLPNSVARCLSKPGFLTICKAKHLWRATGTFTVAGKYPGAKALNRTATRRCVSRVHSAAYRWTYKDKTTWNAVGDHVVVCYTKTRR